MIPPAPPTPSHTHNAHTIFRAGWLTLTVQIPTMHIIEWILFLFFKKTKKKPTPKIVLARLANSMLAQCLLFAMYIVQQQRWLWCALIPLIFVYEYIFRVCDYYFSSRNDACFVRDILEDLYEQHFVQQSTVTFYTQALLLLWFYFIFIVIIIFFLY